MTIVIVVAGLAVMVLAAIAGTGRLGEWEPPVNDSPKGHLPEGPINERFLAELKIPRAMHGYARGEVDELLRAIASGAQLYEPPAFGIVRGGYNMQFVDKTLAQMQQDQPEPAPLPKRAGRIDDEHDQK